ncbi:MAG: hypothetical protein M3464_02010 [Chloroflexota bacterium]|nr:hypothetical protein [Chloroflexota bacterium]
MDGATFDQITKTLGQRASRRSMALGVGLLSVTTVATGRAQVEAQGRLPANCRHFSISGSKRNPRENFNYDDDMKITLIRQNGEREDLLDDEDGVIGIGGRDVKAIRFKAVIGEELKIVARDSKEPCYSIEKMFLHCCKNSRCKRSAASREIVRVREKCGRTEPKGVFFREVIDIR